MKQLNRITADPAIMGGKPCIRGQRVTVGMLTGLVASGKSTAIKWVRFDIPIPHFENRTNITPPRIVSRPTQHPALPPDLLAPAMSG